MTKTRTSAERRVLLAGGTSDAGRAIARALRDAGAEVIVAGRSREKLAALAAEGFGTVEVDLADAEDVDRMMAGLASLDGLIPLVGGWRGGGGIPSQSDDDWDTLSQALTAARHTCRAAW
ncbi:SDR family NAD(P)-dependent oxidoreductase, partial [Microbacterium gubbeenense]